MLALFSHTYQVDTASTMVPNHRRLMRSISIFFLWVCCYRAYPLHAQSPTPPAITPHSIVETIAGGGEMSISALDSGQTVTSTAMSFGAGIQDFAFAPNGTLYFTYPGRLFKQTADGLVVKFAGHGGNIGEGVPIAEANLEFGLHGIFYAPDGSIYLTESAGMDRVRRISPTGIISTVVGTGTRGFSGDGDAATTAQLNRPSHTIVGPDGALYITDTGNNRVRRVGTDGVITTVAGNGLAQDNPTCSVIVPSCGDGRPATQANLDHPYALTFGADGDYYVSAYTFARVRKVDATGVITTTSRFLEDNPNALLWQGQGLTYAPDGYLYLSWYYGFGGRLYRIDPITGIAVNLNDTAIGEITATAPITGDSGPISAATVNYPSNLKFGPDGALYFVDQNGARIRRLAPTSATLAQPAQETTLALGQAITLTIPPNAITQPSTVTLALIHNLAGPLTDRKATRHRFRAQMAVGATNQTEFAIPLTLTLAYNDADWQDAGSNDERKLNLFFWDGVMWTPMLPCTGCSHDTEANRIIVQLDHLTDFVLMEQEFSLLPTSLFLPIINR